MENLFPVKNPIPFFSSVKDWVIFFLTFNLSMASFLLGFFGKIPSCLIICEAENFWTISSAQNHCGYKKWSLTLRWGRDTQSFVVCRAHSGQHKSNWTLVEDVGTFFASENPEYTLLSHLQTIIGCCISLLTSSQAVCALMTGKSSEQFSVMECKLNKLGTLPVSLD